MYLDDARKPAGLRRGHPCPLEYLNVQIADRFHVLPWDVENAPADRYGFYARLLTIESAARAEMAGLEPDEEFYREG